MGTEEIHNIKDTMAPMEAVEVVDPAVINKLPPGTRVIKIATHGSSFWTRTARIDVEQQDGTPKAYFLKTSHSAHGKAMLASEFTSMAHLSAVMPDLAPAPLAWGTYAGTTTTTPPDIHFLLCEFRAMTGETPRAEVLARQVAELHLRSIVAVAAGDSVDGSGGGRRRFGSDIPTFHGNVRVDHGWEDSWESYFARTTRALFELEQKARGPNEEIQSLITPFFEKVIPRLLRPMETGGRSISPCLVHGDLWHGNAETDAETGRPVIFDAASFYAHNEYDLGVWRQPWNRIDGTYRTEYHKHFPPSAPQEDCDDRNALYATRVNVLDSILYKDDPTYRHMIISGMRELVDKYPGGFEEWEAKGSQS
ncbi:Fructosamine kinase-domain-containing protein [Hypoxylon fragiforme]|uniref:Fructosamine kinase-domain-containing protein n=1 Tax=Hypoxylon fragiforme TaxID=63214 RepID=UPI0020C5C813|nr:Fructosamine kinase-domain-containing protein [Hypoxylon fragiforme]KAI2612028.1 Fructosamine kinase-domain-containing protein [Hypoxylon fragiforme]